MSNQPKSSNNLVIGTVAIFTIAGAILVAAVSQRSAEGVAALTPEDVRDSAAHVAAAPDEPVDGGVLSLRLDQRLHVDGDDDAAVMVELAAPLGEPTRAPVHLVLVLDASPSMQGNKIANAKVAMRDLVGALRDEDHLSIVAFGTTAEVRREMAVLGPDRARARAAIESLDSNMWGTCISCGLDAAYNVLSRVKHGADKRVLLLSDGEANAGVQDEAQMSGLVSHAYRRGAITSSIGLGKGIDAPLLAAVSKAGTGDYYFVRNSAAIPNVLDRELRAYTTAAMSRVTLTLSRPPAVSYDRERVLDGVPVPPQHFDVGRLGFGQTRRYLVPVRFTQGYEGRALEVVARWIDADGQPQTSARVANITRTNDPLKAARSADFDVQAELLDAMATARIGEALKAQSYGDTAKARRILDEVTRAADTLDPRGSSAAVKHVKDEVDSARTRLASLKPGTPQLEAAMLNHYACENERARGIAPEAAYHAFDTDAELNLE